MQDIVALVDTREGPSKKRVLYKPRQLTAISN